MLKQCWIILFIAVTIDLFLWSFIKKTILFNHRYFFFVAEVNVVQPHVPYIVQFITHIAQDPDHSDGTLAASAGVIG